MGEVVQAGVARYAPTREENTRELVPRGVACYARVQLAARATVT